MGSHHELGEKLQERDRGPPKNLLSPENAQKRRLENADRYFIVRVTFMHFFCLLYRSEKEGFLVVNHFIEKGAVWGHKVI